MLTTIHADFTQSRLTALAALSENRLVTGSADGVIQVWNVLEGDATAIQTYKNTTIFSPIKLLKTLRDKQWVFIAYDDGRIEIVDFSSKAPNVLPLLIGQKSKLVDFFILPNNYYLMAGYEDGHIQVWNLNLILLAPKEIQVPVKRQLLDTGIQAFTAVGDYFAAADNAGKIHVWKTPAFSSRKLKHHFNLEAVITVDAAEHNVAGLALLQRSNLHIMSVSSAGKMQHWQVKEGEAALVDEHPLASNGEPIVALISASNTSQWVTASSSQVRVWTLPEKILKNTSVPASENTNNNAKRSSIISSKMFNNVKALFERKSASNLKDEQAFNNVHACAFLSAGMLVVAHGDKQFSLWQCGDDVAQNVESFDSTPIKKSFPLLKISKEVKPLGKGAFGRVYQANLLLPETQFPVAVKEVASLGAELVEEMRLHIQLSHWNILSFYGAVYEELEYSLVTEFMSGGDLNQKLQLGVALSDSEITELMLDIVAGLAYLHSLNIIYRDLKPANVLLNAQGRAKLADFGISCQWDGQSPGIEEFAGTLQYMAPELFAFRLDPSNKSYSNKATDIFSLAILFWEMVAQEGMPYKIQSAGLTPTRQNELKRMISKFDRRVAPRHNKPGDEVDVTPGRVRDIIAQFEKIGLDGKTDVSSVAPQSGENSLQDQVRDFEKEWHANQEKIALNDLEQLKVESALEAAGDNMALLDELSKQQNQLSRARNQLNKSQEYIYTERLICLVLLGERPAIPAQTHEGFRALITQCGLYQAKDRPTIAKVEAELQTLKSTM